MKNVNQRNLAAKASLLRLSRIRRREILAVFALEPSRSA